jgi:hypothetical protein
MMKPFNRIAILCVAIGSLGITFGNPDDEDVKVGEHRVKFTSPVSYEAAAARINAGLAEELKSFKQPPVTAEEVRNAFIVGSSFYISVNRPEVADLCRAAVRAEMTPKNCAFGSSSRQPRVEQTDHGTFFLLDVFVTGYEWEAGVHREATKEELRNSATIVVRMVAVPR